MVNGLLIFRKIFEKPLGKKEKTMAIDIPKDDISELEQSISKSLKISVIDQMSQIRELMLLMGEKPKKQAVVVTYPSANSVI